ncbi:MAG: hypothetical protein E3J72_12835 [Planctomycetota bacterium]|nr:MAG: hypothetical protein E3J72_12835 [Planctomycetota bacterium]
MHANRFLPLLLPVLIAVLYCAPAVPQEAPDGKERVDLPIERTEEATTESPGGNGTVIDPPPEKPLPPIEIVIWENPIETDEIIFVLDRTGSMKYRYNGTVIDLEGNSVFGATKMEAVNLELKRAIMNLSENVKFNISYYAHRWGTGTGGHSVYTPTPGPEPASHTDPPGSEPDVVTWQSKLVQATEKNKASAFAWIDAKGTPNGCTCISDGCVDGGLAYNSKTVVLLTDGWPNTFRRTIYYSDFGYDVDYVFNRTKTEIKSANRQNATIHTFYIPYGNPGKDAKARLLMQEIAAMNGPGTFTQIGG